MTILHSSVRYLSDFEEPIRRGKTEFSRMSDSVFMVPVIVLRWYLAVKVVNFVMFCGKTQEFTVVSQIREFRKSQVNLQC